MENSFQTVLCIFIKACLYVFVKVFFLFFHFRTITWVRLNGSLWPFYIEKEHYYTRCPPLLILLFIWFLDDKSITHKWIILHFFYQCFGYISGKNPILFYTLSGDWLPIGGLGGVMRPYDPRPPPNLFLYVMFSLRFKTPGTFWKKFTQKLEIQFFTQRLPPPPPLPVFGHISGKNPVIFDPLSGVWPPRGWRWGYDSRPPPPQ